MLRQAWLLQVSYGVMENYKTRLWGNYYGSLIDHEFGKQLQDGHHQCRSDTQYNFFAKTKKFQEQHSAHEQVQETA
jgi:hypothetical protein